MLLTLHQYYAIVNDTNHWLWEYSEEIDTMSIVNFSYVVIQWKNDWAVIN